MPEAGNVVRLPREWLGPPEELVPFGPSARATAGERIDSDLPESTRPAADFWGEGSEMLQDVIEAPAEPDVVETPEAVEEPSPSDAAAAEEETGAQLAADHPTLQPAPRQRAKAGPRRWQTALSRNRHTRLVAAAVLVLCVIAGTVVLASQGARPAAQIGTLSSRADPFGRLVPRAVAVAQARLTRAETNFARATRHVAAPRQHPAHQGRPIVSTPPTAADTAPAAAGDGTSQTIGGGFSPPATPTQYSPPAEPAQSTYSPPQHSAPAPEPPRVSPSGALTCISNCG